MSHKALLICNSVFPNDPAGLPPLQGPLVDGIRLWAALTEPSVGLFPAEAVLVLHERSFAEILSEAEEFFTSAKPSDILFFYYSGHGLQAFRELYLCGRDSTARRLASSAVSADSLKKMMERSHAGTIIIVLDCCYSGAFAKGVAPVTPDQLAGSGRYVITASSSTQTAADTGHKGHPSPFTAALVDGLHGAADDADQDGYVDLDDLFRHLKRALPQGLPEPRRKFDGTGAVTIARRYASPAKGQGQDVSAGKSDSDSRTPDMAADAVSDGPPAVPPVSLASSFGSLHLRQRGDYSYGDLRSWMVNALTALLLAALATLGLGPLQEATQDGSLASGPDVDVFSVVCCITASIMLAVSAVEAVAVRRVMAKARTRRDILDELWAGVLHRVIQVRDGLTMAVGAYLVQRLVSDNFPLTQYSLMLALLAVFPLVTVARWMSRGDDVYLAGVLLALSALLAPRSYLGYGAGSAFGALAAIHLLLVLAMLFGWLVRQRPGRLTALALLPLIPCLITPLVDDFLPLLAVAGCALALIGCVIGNGIPIHGTLPLAPTDYWPQQLMRRLNHPGERLKPRPGPPDRSCPAPHDGSPL